MEAKSYVYILISNTGKSFKIGKTDNLYLRYETLRKFWGDFSLDDSYALKCDMSYAYKLEKLLQNLVIDSRVSFDTIDQKDGWTEFFDISAFDELKEFAMTVLPTFKKNIEFLDFREYVEKKQEVKELDRMLKMLNKI